MGQLALLGAPRPPDFDGIEIRCCGVDEVLAEVRGARLIHADPPWQYSVGAAGKGMAQPELNGIYNCTEDAVIVAHLDRSFDCAAPDSRLVCWYTWPKSAEWRAAGMAGPRWGAETSGGAWVKTHQFGVGYHWRGQSEPIAMFTKGTTGRPNEAIINAHVSPPSDHSEKPIDWLRAMVRAWTSHGDLVLDLYAGLAPLARACRAEGRRYIGAEIDPERAQRARERLALYTWRQA